MKWFVDMTETGEDELLEIEPSKEAEEEIKKLTGNYLVIFRCCGPLVEDEASGELLATVDDNARFTFHAKNVDEKDFEILMKIWDIFALSGLI